jgi:hypothetical protein
MPRIIREIYTCSVCGKEYDAEESADKCYLSHDIIYVGLERREWKELLQNILAANYGGFHFNEQVVNKLLKHKLGVKRNLV